MKLAIILLSIFYFLIFIVSEVIFTVEPPYGVYSWVALFIYLFFWILPIFYLWNQEQLSIKNIVIIILINIFGVISFYYFSNTPSAIEIRRIPEIKTREQSKKLQKLRKMQEIPSGNIQK